jgi:heme-degrading monooxygenase HmoA
MFARLTRFPRKPGTDDQLDQLGQKYEKVLHDLPGHQSTVMYLEDDALVSVTTWDSEEHAQAATQAAREPAVQDAADALAGAPTTTIARALVHDLRH